MASFTKIIPMSALEGSGLLLAAEFRDACIPESGPYMLENGEGKQWKCTVTKKQQGTHTRADITGGWRPFANQNGLKVGDEIKVEDLGNRAMRITKTGRTGAPRTTTPRAPKAAAGSKTPRARSTSKTPKKAGGATPASGGVTKRRGSSTATRRRSMAAVAAAAAPEPAGAEGGEEAPVPAGQLLEYVPPTEGYLPPIWPRWCSIM